MVINSSSVPLVVIPIEFVKTGEGAAELPLPTYDQSEKYEVRQDMVLAITQQ